MIGIPVIFNFYRWQNDNWFELAKQEMWNRFHQLDMDNHSFKYETTELLDQELGLEAKNLTIHFTMYVEKVNGTVFKKKIDFATTDGARRIFGDKSALRAKYEMEEPRRPAPATVKHEDAQEAKAETKEGANRIIRHKHHHHRLLHRCGSITPGCHCLCCLPVLR